MDTTLWTHATFLFIGYEVDGMENIPDKGPALIIYYHGAIPIDIYYFMAKVLAKERLVHTVGDYFLFKVPGKICFIFWWNFKIKHFRKIY